MEKFSAKTVPFLIHSPTILKAVVKDENIIPIALMLELNSR